MHKRLDVHCLDHWLKVFRFGGPRSVEAAWCRESGNLGFVSATDLLCDLGEDTSFLCASASPSVKWS